MNYQERNALSVGDPIAVSPKFTSDPYLFGVVSKVTEKQITVTVSSRRSGMTFVVRFMRESGREVGNSGVSYRHFLCTVDEAERRQAARDQEHAHNMKAIQLKQVLWNNLPDDILDSVIKLLPVTLQQKGGGK